MGFWSWLTGADEPQRRDESQNEITPQLNDVLLKALLGNEVITREKALTLPAVSGAVDYITSTVAAMPVKLYKYRAGKVEELADDPRVKLLNSDTGDTLDGFQLKKAMVEDYLLGKGGYCYIQRWRNDCVALRYVKDEYVTIMSNYKPIYKDYDILVEGQKYKKHEFIKLLRNTKDGASGVGLTQEVSKALETAYQTLLYQLGQVKSGGNKRGFLKAQRKLAQEEINTLKAAWANMYGNAANSDNIVVLNNGLEFQEASNSALEMQLDSSKNTLRSEINNIFHIHEGDFESTFKEAIYPIIKAFETALNRDLLLEKEKKNYFFEFDVKEIVKASLTERYNAYRTAKETGFMTLNEIRKAENLPYVEGLDVVNVGLGAVLYDVNTHKYYTPNTDTTGDPNDNVNGGETADGGDAMPTEGNMDSMLVDHELVDAYDESGNNAERAMQERYNEHHDAKTGRFAAKGGSGGGGGGGLSPEDNARIEELSKQLEETKSIFAKARIKNEIEMIQEGFKGTLEEYTAEKRKKQEEAQQAAAEAKAKADAEAKAAAEAKAKAEAEQLEYELKTQPKEKVEQYKIIQETNPMNDDYHVGIRKPSDIKTWAEVVAEGSNDGESFAWGDFSEKDAQKALKTGKVTVYSSYPIGQGGFVSTSKTQAEQYAGGAGNKVYSKTVPLEDVAWINGDEGQFAKLGKKRELEEDGKEDANED